MRNVSPQNRRTGVGLRRALFVFNLSPTSSSSRQLPPSCSSLYPVTYTLLCRIIFSRILSNSPAMPPSPNPLFKFNREGYSVNVTSIADAGGSRLPLVLYVMRTRLCSVTPRNHRPVHQPHRYVHPTPPSLLAKSFTRLPVR